MKLIVVSSPSKFRSEAETMEVLFEKGLPLFHLRKPSFSRNKMKDYLGMIPKKYHDRIVLHSHYDLAVKYKLAGIHLGKSRKKTGFKGWLELRWLRMRRPQLTISTSFHNLLSLVECTKRYSYVFLSPIYEGISKKSHGSSFSPEQLRKAILNTNQNVVALGGIDSERIVDVREIGFYGGAVLGAIWNSDQAPEEAFSEIQQAFLSGVKPNARHAIKPVKIDLKAI